MTRQDLIISINEIGKVYITKENPDFIITCIPVHRPDGSTSSVCYSCTIPALPGKFDVLKAMQLRVPKGPLFAKLKNGISVTLEDGTVIHPDQVLGPKDVSKAVIIVSHISLEEEIGLLEHLINNNIWERCVSLLMTNYVYVIKNIRILIHFIFMILLYFNYKKLIIIIF